MGMMTGSELDELKSENRKASSLSLESLNIIIGRYVFIYLQLLWFSFAADSCKLHLKRKCKVKFNSDSRRMEGSSSRECRTNKEIFGVVSVSTDKSIFHF